MIVELTVDLFWTTALNITEAISADSCRHSAILQPDMSLSPPDARPCTNAVKPKLSGFATAFLDPSLDSIRRQALRAL